MPDAQWCRRPRRAPPGRCARSAATLGPLVIILVVCVVDAVGGPDFVIIALVMGAPLLAASFAGPRLTGIYAVAALAGAGALAVSDGVTDPGAGGGPSARLIRLVGIALAGVVAVGVSRARQARNRRMTELVRVAEVAQRAILGTVPETMHGLRFAAAYRSAAVEARVGGDLYEVVDGPWGVRLIVGDVRGKGLGAVRLTSRVLGTFRALAGRLDDPGSLIVALDREVAGFEGDEPDSGMADFVTAVVAQVDEAGWMQLFNAGHPDPLRVRRGRVEALCPPARDLPLGLGCCPDPTRVQLGQSDRVLFYTDGLAEARHPATRQFFPLRPAVQAAFAAGRELPESLAVLVDALADWTEGSLDDDVAMVAVERVGQVGQLGQVGQVGRGGLGGSRGETRGVPDSEAVVEVVQGGVPADVAAGLADEAPGPPGDDGARPVAGDGEGLVDEVDRMVQIAAPGGGGGRRDPGHGPQAGDARQVEMVDGRVGVDTRRPRHPELDVGGC
ncbi:serine/threonine-protein phosphatase [Frankia sp. Cpl3]|nr:serine/threonine-protein phosphatase [Frankia sp. Cpl3]